MAEVTPNDIRDDKKKVISLICEAVNIYAQIYGQPQTVADKELFDIAELILKKNGRAVHFLEHFLYGDGSPINFDLALLLRESANVRKVISTTIKSRLEANPGLINRTMSGGPFEFPIHQWDYKLEDRDWQYALGTFFIEWEVDHSKSLQPVPSSQLSASGPLCSYQLVKDWVDSVTTTRTGMRPSDPWSVPAIPPYARIYGSKEYHWHDKTDRVDECLHQAGFRLNAAGAAKNFWMIAKPCIIQISTGWPVG